MSVETFFPEESPLLGNASSQAPGANPWACRVARRISFSIIEVCLDVLGLRLEWLLENTNKPQIPINLKFWVQQ